MISGCSAVWSAIMFRELSTGCRHKRSGRQQPRTRIFQDMLHHVSFGVSNIERSAAVLAPLGYVRVWDDLRPGAPDQAVG